MSVWDRISDATRFDFGRRRAPEAGPVPSKRKGQHWMAPWAFIGIVVGLIWVIASGWAYVWLEDFKIKLLALIPDVTIILTLAGFLGLLLAFLFLKAPAEHFLARYGKRLVWYAPVAIIGGAAIIPVMIVVTSLAQKGAADLSESYLGGKPAANICAAANVVPPAITPTPRAR